MSIIGDELFRRAIPEPNTGCWLWLLQPNKQTGYGEFWYDKKRYLAHRLSYELEKGPIPEGLQIDHICRVRSCINPDHLRCVTIKENVLCGVGPAAQNLVKTHCKYGHEFTLENTRYAAKYGNRICRECTRIDNRRRRNKRYVSRKEMGQ